MAGLTATPKLRKAEKPWYPGRADRPSGDSSFLTVDLFRVNNFDSPGTKTAVISLTDTRRTGYLETEETASSLQLCGSFSLAGRE